MGLLYEGFRLAQAAGQHQPQPKPSFKVTDRRAAGGMAARAAWVPAPVSAAPAAPALRQPTPPPPATPAGISTGVGRDGLPDLAATMDWVAHVLTYAGTLTRKVCDDCMFEGEVTCEHVTENPDLFPPYLGWGSKHAVHVATAWGMHTWARLPCRSAEHGHGPDTLGDLVTPASPRLGIFAPEGGAGKTMLAKLVLAFSCNPTMEDEPTGPATARLLGLRHHTVALDEGDILFGSGMRKQMVRSLLNNGYTPGGHNSHAEGSRSIVSLSTYGPVLVAAIDKIEKNTGDHLKPLLSRFIKIRLEKAPRGYRPNRMRRNEWAGVRDLTDHIQVRMTEAATLRDIAAFEGDLPGYMEARTAEIWEPLYAIAHVAGGEWPQRIAAAADWFENNGEQRARAASRLTAATATLGRLS